MLFGSICKWSILNRNALLVLNHERDSVPNVLIIGEPLKGCAQCFVCKLWAKNRSALLNNVFKRKQKPIRMTEAASLKHTCFCATFRA